MDDVASYFITQRSRGIRQRTFTKGELADWQEEILQIYQCMRERAKEGIYTVDVNGLELEVFPGVYAPGFFTDTAWFCKELPLLVGARSLLEIGTGTGAIAA